MDNIADSPDSPILTVASTEAVESVMFDRHTSDESRSSCSSKFEDIFLILLGNSYFSVSDLPRLFAACNRYCLSLLKDSNTQSVSLDRSYNLIGFPPKYEILRWAATYRIEFKKIVFSNPQPREPDGWSSADYYGCHLIDFSRASSLPFNPLKRVTMLSLTGCLLKEFPVHMLPNLKILLLHDSHSVQEVPCKRKFDYIDPKYRGLFEIRFRYRYKLLHLQDLTKLCALHVCDRRVCSTAALNQLVSRGVVTKVYFDSLHREPGQEWKHIQLEKPRMTQEGFYTDSHHRADYATVYITPNLVQMVPF